MIKGLNPKIEKWRVRDSPEPWFNSNSTYGNNGVFKVRGPDGFLLHIIASDGYGWEHCSVSLPEVDRCPTWPEMCFVKDLFWGKEECVVQYHPPQSQYVDNHPYCLHLWKPVGMDIPAPPAKLVGLKDGFVIGGRRKPG